jgi:hypothetical protein
MYVLSANSQNMQGDGIDLLCLEEPLGSVPSEICHREMSLHSGESQEQNPKRLGSARISRGLMGFS